MDHLNLPAPIKEKMLVSVPRSASLDSSYEQLKKAKIRLDQYQAALRLANGEIKRRSHAIIALTKFAYQASQAAGPTTVLKLALIQALETANAPVGAIVLADLETKELTLSVHHSLAPELIDILTGHQLEKGATALMPHMVAGSGALLEYDSTDDEDERQLLEVSQLTSLVSLPLQVGSRLLGALLIGLQDNHSFTAAELWFLMALSQEMATALESLRLREGLWHTAEMLLDEEDIGIDLQEAGEVDFDIDVPTPFDLPTAAATVIPEPDAEDLEQLLAGMVEAQEEVQQQNTDLQTLNTIAEMMNRTLNLKEILQSAVDQTKAALDTDAAWLYLVNERNQLDMRAHTGLSKAYIRAMQLLKLKDGLEGQAVTENEARFVGSLTEEGVSHKIWVDKEKLQGVAVVPITRPDTQARRDETASHVIGVLATGTIAEPHPWSHREMNLLASIANHVALAIDNAQLYEKLQDNEANLRAGNEVLQEINDMLSAENASLVKFMEDYLQSGLVESNEALKHLLTVSEDMLNEVQQHDIATLREIIRRLTEMSKWVTHTA